MFSQLFIIAMGLLLLVVNLANQGYLMAMLGAFVAFIAAHRLYKLKTGKELTLGGIRSIDDVNS